MRFSDATGSPQGEGSIAKLPVGLNLIIFRKDLKALPQVLI
jgi:hypothetical protein